jgi:hypothetical protein
VKRVPHPFNARNKDKEMDTLTPIVIMVTFFAAWLTHIFTCFTGAMWGFLIAGAVFFPVGILHGLYLWFN